MEASVYALNVQSTCEMIYNFLCAEVAPLAADQSIPSGKRQPWMLFTLLSLYLFNTSSFESCRRAAQIIVCKI